MLIPKQTVRVFIPDLIDDSQVVIRKLQQKHIAKRSNDNLYSHKIR